MIRCIRVYTKRIRTTTLRVKRIENEVILLVLIIGILKKIIAMIIVMIIKVIHIHLKLENVKKAIFYWKNAKFLRCKY